MLVSGIILKLDKGTAMDAFSKVYNVAVWMPEHLISQVKCDKPYRMIYTEHAKRAANTDKYGRIPLPNQVMFSRSDIVELTTENGKVAKIVIRLPYTNDINLVYVLRLMDSSQSKLLCVTCWINKSSDKHVTLNKTVFQKKPK